MWPDDFINKVICGDCLEVLKEIPSDVRLSVITDPVWPDSVVFVDIDDPQELLKQALHTVLPHSERVVIHLGLDSDPRFLTAVPTQLRFVRSFALRYARPHYKGRILYDRDMAYLFGSPPTSRKGNHVLPGGVIDGDTITSDNSGRLPGHPCARKLDHVLFLVDRCTDPGSIVLDPFAGSGTTLVAAKQHGRQFIGIDINPDYCKIAIDRLRQEEMGL